MTYKHSSTSRYIPTTVLLALVLMVLLWGQSLRYTLAATALCGDGKISSVEECDDGNRDNYDGCNDTCNIETGWQCTGAKSKCTLIEDPSSQASAESSSKEPLCGNGKIDVGEECDDGASNGTAPDCNSQCKIPYCGDGEVEPSRGEECEPQKAKDGSYLVPQCGRICTVDKCSGANRNTCAGGCKWKVVSCTGTGSSSAMTSATSALSSTSIQHLASSENAKSSESSQQSVSSEHVSSAASTVPSQGAASSLPPVNPTSFYQIDFTPVCGNNLTEGNEQCDTGGRNSLDPNHCRPDCTLPVCGDGIVDTTTEQCDDGSKNSDTVAGACRTNCKKSSCGDGILDPGEKCDNGTKNSDTVAGACRTSCKKASCGDGVIDAGEQCDDGLKNGSKTCTKECKLPAVCGDGKVEQGEECDDKNVKDGDGCSRICKAEAGYSCSTDEPSVCAPVCGDGIKAGAEQCDDGNALSGDGCTATCESEHTFGGFLQWIIHFFLLPFTGGTPPTGK